MKEFTKKYKASWSHLDPNWHVANHQYFKFAVDTRVAFFEYMKLDKSTFEKYKIGPVLLYEHMHYYKEILLGVDFIIDAKIDGYSEDAKFFTIHQNFYDKVGNHLAHLDLAFGLLDIKSRKLTSMPNDSFEIFKNGPKTDSFKILTKEDMRRHGKFPKNLN